LFPALSLATCLPLMIAGRLVDGQNPLLYVGLAAGVFLPFSVYGSSLSLIQGGIPHRMRASIVGFTMMCLNVLALALGTFTMGLFSDRLAAGGHGAPLTAVLLGADALIATAIVFYAMAAHSISRSLARSAAAHA
jgi:hypothetical protein